MFVYLIWILSNKLDFNQETCFTINLLLEIIFQKHKHYNYYNQYQNRHYFHMFLKMASSEAWVHGSWILRLKWVGRRFGSRRGQLLIKISECYVRVNICNWSKLLEDTTTVLPRLANRHDWTSRQPTNLKRDFSIPVLPDSF